MIVLGLLLMTALGGALTMAFARRSLSLVALWFPIGCGVISICAFLLQVIGCGALLPWVAIALVVAFAAKVKVDPLPPSAFRLPPYALVAFIVAIIAAATSYVLHASRHPFGGWDAFTRWNYYASFIAAIGDDWIHQVRDARFASLMRVTHPLLLAETVAAFGRPGVLAAAFAITLVALMIALTARLSNLSYGLAAGIALLCIRDFVVVAAWRYADVPLAVYVLATIGLIALAMRGDARMMTLAGVAAGLTAWTKNEGLAFAVASTIVVVLFRRRLPPSSLRRFCAGLAIPLAVALLFRARYAIPNRISAAQGSAFTVWRLTDFDRYAMLLRLTGCYVGRHAIMLVSLACFAVSQGIDRDRLRDHAWAFVIVALYLCAYAASVIVSPAPIEWQIRTTVDRVALQVWPAVILVVFSALRQRSPAVSRVE